MNHGRHYLARSVAVWFLVLLAACFLAAHSFGASPAEAARFQVAGFGDSFFEGIKFEAEEGRVVELRFLPNRRSRPYRLPDVYGELTFFRETTDQRGRIRREPLAVAKLVPGAEEMLFVFLPIANGSGEALTFRVITVDQSPSAFGPGELQFLNLAGVALGGSLGDRPFEAPPGLSERLRAPEGSEALQLRFYVDSAVGRQLAFSTRIRAGEEEGALFVIKPPLRESELRLRVERLW